MNSRSSTPSSTPRAVRSTPHLRDGDDKARYNSLPADLKKVIDANSGLATSGWLGKVQQAGDAAGRKAATDRGNNHLHRQRGRSAGVPPPVPRHRSRVGGRHEQARLRRSQALDTARNLIDSTAKATKA